MGSPSGPSSSSIIMAFDASPTTTVSIDTRKTEIESAHITPPPELRLRSPIPEPQNNAVDCDSADRSASQAIREASQQASDAIRQASQQATQSVQQANQSASQAIQQFSNSASQSIAAASRSASSAVSSASSAIASAQASADQAISRANGSMMTAVASASVAQADASKAVLQAGAAVAAATGSAAAAGSSFLQAAAKATQGAQASVSQIGAAASSFVSVANDQAQESRTAAITATQAAVAIVGSIIASTLLTMLIYFLVVRHKKSARRKKRGPRSPINDYSSNPKLPVQDQVGTNTVTSQGRNFSKSRNQPAIAGSPASFFHLPTSPTPQSQAPPQPPRESVVKTTSLPWNPNKPPKAPTLASWLKVQETVSPIGSIKLPVDKTPLPLGGQLKSPLQSSAPQKSPRLPSLTSPPRTPKLSLFPTTPRSPMLPVLMESRSAVTTLPKSPLTPAISNKSTPRPILDDQYRERKASVWIDEVPSPSPSPRPVQWRGPKATPAPTRRYDMEIPRATNPVRNTAEWLAARQEQRLSRPDQGFYPSNSGRNRQTIGLPGNPRMGSSARPGMGKPLKSSEIEIEQVQGLNRFLNDETCKDVGESKTGSEGNRLSSLWKNSATPGVGKAL